MKIGNGNTPKRDEIWLVALDPTQGSEIQKTRPCVVVSPDEMNRRLRTVISAPMTASAHPFASRVSSEFQHKQGQVALDQIRTVDRQRLIRKLGLLAEDVAQAVSSVLVEMFTRG